MSGEQRWAAAEPRTVRGVRVALLSLVVPGAGQLVAGARRRGGVMLAVTVLLLVAAWQGLRGPGAALELLVRPGGLAGILAGNAALVVFRVYATLDAFRVGAGGVGRRASEQGATPATVAAVALLAAVVLAPHGLVAHYTLVAHDTLHDVFAGSLADGAVTPDRPEAVGHDRSSSGNGSSAGDGPSGSAERGGADPVWLQQDRLTVAVLGSDAAPGRPGDRLDAILVVSVDLESGLVTVFSVERHLREFPLPEALQGAWERGCRDAAPGWDLLNALYRCGDEAIPDVVAHLYPTAPDPAAAAVADTLGTLLDIPVDHYVMVDMAGFVQVIDVLGGVHLDLDRPARPDGSGSTHGCDWRAFDVQPGSRELDGAEALDLVRDRTGTTSADRMGRQRCMLVTLAHQVDAPHLLRRFGQLAVVARQHVTTSIPLEELPAAVDLVSRIDRGDILTVGFGVPDHVNADSTPRTDLIRDEVQRSLERRPAPLASHRTVR